MAGSVFISHARPFGWLRIALGLLLAVPLCTSAIAENAAGASSVLEEIVVTARKQTESLQDVPIAVSVLSGSELAERGALALDAIGKISPNVHFDQTGGGGSGVPTPQVFIRGMGQADFIATEDPAVGIYLDGVYMGRNMGSVFDLVDVERVEVLRGPQGTLFGRNTIGGAINLISKAPGTELGGSVGAELGEDGYQVLKATVNVPLGGSFGARVSAFARQQDGYVEALQYDNFDLGEDDVWGIRARLGGNVSDTFSIDLAVDYSKSEAAPGGSSMIGIGLIEIVFQLALNGGPNEVFHGFGRVMQVIGWQIKVLIQPGFPQTMRPDQTLGVPMPLLTQMGPTISCFQQAATSQPDDSKVRSDSITCQSSTAWNRFRERIHGHSRSFHPAKQSGQNVFCRDAHLQSQRTLQASQQTVPGRDNDCTSQFDSGNHRR